MAMLMAVLALMLMGQTPIWRNPADTRLPDMLVTVRPDESGVGREVRDIRGRIDDGRDAGVLSRRDARRLDREARYLGRLGERYGRDGLSDAERRELDIRSRVLRERVDARRLAGAGRRS
jgi:hypothetical protein